MKIRTIIDLAFLLLAVLPLALMLPGKHGSPSLIAEPISNMTGINVGTLQMISIGLLFVAIIIYVVGGSWGSKEQRIKEKTELDNNSTIDENTKIEMMSEVKLASGEVIVSELRKCYIEGGKRNPENYSVATTNKRICIISNYKSIFGKYTLEQYAKEPDEIEATAGKQPNLEKIYNIRYATDKNIGDYFEIDTFLSRAARIFHPNAKQIVEQFGKQQENLRISAGDQTWK
ncbi:hypothetical protein HY990_00755 [Candidatus Micrarchaeota archaeon]|nr:hypothetical protein [Candidatus Micrarchaeota archaeon]